MKLKINTRYLLISLYAAGAIALGGIIILLAANIGQFGGVFKTISGIFGPVILAVAFAYILNPIVQFFEFKVFKRWQIKAYTPAEKRRIHSLSLWLTIIISLIVLIGFLWLILPQLVSSVIKMAEQFDNLPVFFNEAQAWINLVFGANSQVSKIIENPLNELENIVLSAWDMLKPQILPFFTKMGGEVVNAFGTAFNVLLAAVIAVNLLSVKEMLLKQSRKVMYSVIPKEACSKILVILGKSNKIFKRYIVGLSLDSLIVGILCFLGSTVMGIQYALLIGIIFAVCNFIPMFGPFIGAVPASLIILTDEPAKLIWFLIFLIIVQQIDGNILAPLIHGDAMGVPSVWVLISIIIGGGFFGFIGMLLSVPVFAIIYMLAKEITESRLERKGLPVSSNLYSDALISETSEAQNIDDEIYYAERKRSDPFIKRLFRFFKVLFTGKSTAKKGKKK